jgi:hypothetical protein
MGAGAGGGAAGGAMAEATVGAAIGAFFGIGTVIPAPWLVTSSTIAAAAAGRTAGTPCGGVPAANFFGDASRGNSAPQPRQNL